MRKKCPLLKLEDEVGQFRLVLARYAQFVTKPIMTFSVTSPQQRFRHYYLYDQLPQNGTIYHNWLYCEKFTLNEKFLHIFIK